MLSLIVTTIQRTVCQFCKRNLGGKDLINIHCIHTFFDSIAFAEILNPSAGVQNILLRQSSRLMSSINSFLRPSLMAASIRSASGSSFQLPASDISPRLRSSLESIRSPGVSFVFAKDSVKKKITIFFSSELKPSNKLVYGAIGVSAIRLANAVITSDSFVLCCKSTYSL